MRSEWLAALLVALPFSAGAAPLGTVRGVVSMSGQPAPGLEVALVGLASGEVHRVVSDAEGSFEVDVEPGRYLLTGQGAGKVRGGSSFMSVTPDSVTVARLDLAPVEAVQDPTPGQPAPLTRTQGDVTLTHDEISCVVELKYPIVDGLLQPPTAVKNAVVYFRGSLSDDWFKVPFTPASLLSDDMPGASLSLSPDSFVGVLPFPTTDASPIYYYLEINGEVFTPEIEVVVLPEGQECKGRLAAVALVGPGALAAFGGAALAPLAIVGIAAGGVAGVGGIIALATGSPSR